MHTFFSHSYSTHHADCFITVFGYWTTSQNVRLVWTLSRSHGASGNIHLCRTPPASLQHHEGQPHHTADCTALWRCRCHVALQWNRFWFICHWIYSKQLTFLDLGPRGLKVESFDTSIVIANLFLAVLQVILCFKKCYLATLCCFFILFTLLMSQSLSLALHTCTHAHTHPHTHTLVAVRK